MIRDLIKRLLHLNEDITHKEYEALRTATKELLENKETLKGGKSIEV